MSRFSPPRISSARRASRAFRHLVRRAGLTTLGLGLLLTPALLWPMVASADPPIAIDDSVTVAEDVAPTVVDVLANDETSDNLTIVAATDPAHGTVVVAANGLSLTYEPDANYNGPDTFDYTVKDGSDVQTTASVDVTVTPVNDPPVALDDPGDDCGSLENFGESFPIPEDWIGEEEFDGWFVLYGDCGLLANDTDIDGDSLTWEIVGQPSHGEALFVDDDFFAYKADPDFSTLAGNIPGGTWVSDSFTYHAYDGVAYSNTATMVFWIAPVNDPPSFTPGLATVFANEDTEFEAAWATDISTGPPNESDQVVTFEIVDVDGTDFFSAGPVIDADGVLSFTPAPDAFGLANFTVLLRDDGGLENYDLAADQFDPPDDTSDEVSFEIVIMPVNDLPVAEDDVASIVEDDEATSINLVGNDTDVDGGAPEVVAVSDPTHGSARVDAGGATYDPDPDFNGTDSFTYAIEDDDGGEGTATVTITVDPVNDDPVADDDAANVTEDQTNATLIAVLAGDSDVDGEVLHVAAVTDGAKGTVAITGNGLAVRYRPAPNANGSDSFSYTVSDGNGGTATATVNVTIAPVNDRPDAVDDGAPTPLPVAQGIGPTSVGVLANDTSAPDVGETVSIVAVTQPAHGVVAIGGGGSGLTYDPAGLYTGPDQFTYTISDAGGLTDTATVHISVIPDVTPPVAIAPRVVIAAASGATAVRASIAWSAADVQSGISSYQLQQRTDGGAWTTVVLPSPATTRILRTLPVGHDYRFRVRARDGVGNFGAYATSRVTRL